MEFLEDIWEAIGGFFAAIGSGIERSITSLFGSSNARYIKKLQPKVDAINALEPKYQAHERRASFAAQTVEFRQRLAAGATLDDLLVEAFAVCREAGRRLLGMRHYDVQLMGGMVLHRRQYRRNGHRRRQDAGRHAAGLPERPGRQGGPRRHGQRLPGPPRHGVDGPALHGPGPDRGQRSRAAWTRTSGRRRMPATSPTARTTSSASTTCATTCGRRPAATTAIPSASSRRRASCTTPSSTRWTTS